MHTYTYLGIVFDEHLTFSECIKTHTDAAGRALGGLISECQKLKGLGYECYCKLYDSLVVPVQYYEAEIWCIVNSWKSNEILSKCIFQRDLALSRKPNWSHEVLKLFRLYDHVADKNNPSLCCLDRISKLSREFSETNWLNEVNQKPKSRTYILINKTLNPSEYVKSYMSKHKRSLMVQFLTGIFPLKIETGRFKKIRDTSSV